MSAPKDRQPVKDRLCGWCSIAALSPNAAAHHRRCSGPCACGDVQHRFDRKMAERMARFCQLPVDAIYERHGRKRRVLTDEQREAAVARLHGRRAS